MSRAVALLFVGALALAVAEARQGVPVPVPGSAQQAPAAPKPPATGILAGKVVDGTSGAPVGEVTLVLSSPALAAPAGAGPAGVPQPTGPASQSARRAITDGQGRFLFRDLPPGSFQLNASAGGYLSSGAGVMRPNGPSQPIVLPAEGRVLDLTVRMFKYATVGGTVTDEAGEPVVGATIRPFRSEFVGGRRKFTWPGTVATTDDRGAFRLPQLVPGDYAIGFIASSISMPADALVESERARNAGNAANNAFSNDVAASGGNIFTQASIAVGDWRLLYGTNARGPAPSEDGQVVMAYATTFHSGSSSASNATIVTVGSGEDKSVDFQIRPVRTAKVSGILTGPEGPAKFFGLRLLSADVDQFASDSTMDPIQTTTSSSGEFSFLSVPPGTYVLKAVKVPDAAFAPFSPILLERESLASIRPDTSAPTSTQPSLWASLPVQVSGGDIGGLVVTLRTGARVTGHVEFDGVTPPPAANLLKQIPLSIDPPGFGTGVGGGRFFQTWRGQITEAGTFTSAQFPPGRYFIRNPNPPQGWVLDSITANGVDVSDVAMEIGSSDITDVVIRFTDRRSQLSGVVRNGERKPDATASVIVFPADRTLWTDYSSSPRRLRLARATATGAFTFPPLPPGDYLVAAINDGDAGTFMDTKFLEKLAGLATRVTVDRGQTKTQDLTTVIVK